METIFPTTINATTPIENSSFADVIHQMHRLQQNQKCFNVKKP